MSEHDAQITCTGTVWVEGLASDELVHESPAPGTNLQFSRRGLDSSFLMNLNLILMGINSTAIASAAGTDQPIDLGVRRLGGFLPSSDQAAHLYEILTDSCRRFARLMPARVREIAQDWYVLQGHPGTRSRQERIEFRAEMIQNLAAVAQVAEARNARMFLRVVYKASDESCL